MARGWNAKTIITKGLSIARGTTIDAYLLPEDCEVLYEKWQETWPEPFRFSGGITAITCEMVLEVPEDELRAVLGGRKKVEKERPGRILEVAKINGGR
jgi:hypothetical protein